MHGLETIKRMNSPEYQQMKKRMEKNPSINYSEDYDLKVINDDLKSKLEETQNRLETIQKRYKESLISRLQNIENSKTSVPVGTELKICDTDFDSPRVEGKVEHETKKFYVIGGKRYHKYGLKFFDMENGKVVLENTRW
tara:strand:+ start:8996 stop:9412 length:417 start_codon:yes stop_codon:yes gene_type:complete